MSFSFLVIFIKILFCAEPVSVNYFLEINQNFSKIFTDLEAARDTINLLTEDKLENNKKEEYIKSINNSIEKIRALQKDILNYKNTFDWVGKGRGDGVHRIAGRVYCFCCF